MTTYSKRKVSALKKLELKCITRHDLTRENTKYGRSMTGVGTAHQQHEVTVAHFWMDLKEQATHGESKTGLN